MFTSVKAAPLIFLTGYMNKSVLLFSLPLVARHRKPNRLEHNGSWDKSLQGWGWLQGQCDSGALMMSPGIKLLPSFSSATDSIGFILRFWGWTLTALGLPLPTLGSNPEKKEKRTFSPSTVCMEVTNLTGPHWSQSDPWTFSCGQGISLVLGPCLLLLRRWPSVGEGQTPQRKIGGCCHQKKEKGHRTARRLPTSTGYKCHSSNAAKTFSFLFYILGSHWQFHLSMNHIPKNCLQDYWATPFWTVS